MNMWNCKITRFPKFLPDGMEPASWAGRQLLLKEERSRLDHTRMSGYYKHTEKKRERVGRFKVHGLHCLSGAISEAADVAAAVFRTVPTIESLYSGDRSFECLRPL